MQFPFLKQLTVQDGSPGPLDLPEWTKDISEIFNQLQNTIGPPPKATIQFRYEITVPPSDNSPYLQLPFPTKLDFENGELTGVLTETVLIPKEELKKMQQSTRAEVPNAPTGSQSEGCQSLAPNHEQPTELSSIQKIQRTGSIILKYRAYIATLSKGLDLVLENEKNRKPEKQISTRNKNRTREPPLLTEQLEAIRHLKKELMEIDARLDIELLEYCSQRNSFFAWSEWNDLMQHKEAIAKLLNQLKSSSIREKLHRFNVEMSQHSFLAEIIGLQREICEDIFAGLTNHESEEEVIHKYFELVNNSLKQNNTNLPIETVLQHFGFTESRANYIERKIRKLPPQLRHHFSILDFANLFVEDLFKYDLLLTDNQPELPDSSQGNNIDYPVQTFIKGDPLKITCSNFVNNKSLRENLKKFFTLSSDGEKLFEDEEGFQYWYHGTDSYSASDIVEIGIKLHKGKEKKDFSDGNGFYLSDDFQPALRWVQKRVTNPVSAILRYKIPRKFWTDNGLRLSTDNDDNLSKWRSIIRYNRSGQREGGREIENLVEGAPYILGPLSNDGIWEENKNNPNWPTELKNNWNQLCIRNDIAAREFTFFLDKIAFIPKKEDKRIVKY